MAAIQKGRATWHSAGLKGQRNASAIELECTGAAMHTLATAVSASMAGVLTRVSQLTSDDALVDIRPTGTRKSAYIELLGGRAFGKAHFRNVADAATEAAIAAVLAGHCAVSASGPACTQANVRIVIKR